MPKIQLLDKHTAELIAAGEVVDRPASVVKELMENAIDAGATVVTVEVRRGGVAGIRITDNGCGIAREDVPAAFLRHATSKVRTAEDLDAIGTLGFRGEALASVAAVARVEMTTCAAGETAGTRYVIEGGEEIACEDAGCPQGTSIAVTDLFYNVPARMKFLKKDVGEANAAAAVADRLALSHPEVSVRFLRDGREELLTPGDGDLLSCIYAVFGRDFADGMIPVDYLLNGVRVRGYAGRPAAARASRTMQHFFINGRYVKTRTAMAALEEAFKGSLMGGKFPTCVLHIELPLETVDVNVHPAKTEVRFLNERPLFEAVYHGARSALSAGARHEALQMRGGPSVREDLSPHMPEAARPIAPDIEAAEPAEVLRSPAEALRSSADVLRPSAEVLRPSAGGGDFLPVRDAAGVYAPPSSAPPPMPEHAPPARAYAPSIDIAYEAPPVWPEAARRDAETTAGDALASAAERDIPEQQRLDAPAVQVLGEAFALYIIARQGEALYFLDKHAAHERLLYNELKTGAQVQSQLLLEPVTVSLSREEYAALLPELETMARAGFEVEDFGGASVLVRALPMAVPAAAAASAVREIAGGLASGRREITTDKLDWLYHSVACRAAVKAGDDSRPPELQALAERVLLNDDVRTCPHGRPVCFELSRRDIEKQFGRIV